MILCLRQFQSLNSCRCPIIVLIMDSRIRISAVKHQIQAFLMQHYSRERSGGSLLDQITIMTTRVPSTVLNLHTRENQGSEETQATWWKVLESSVWISETTFCGQHLGSVILKAQKIPKTCLRVCVLKQILHLIQTLSLGPLKRSAALFTVAILIPISTRYIRMGKWAHFST
jgi:hypothetical protein